MAGEYTAPPAHGPMTAEICGHDTRGERVAQEDVRIARERDDASWMRGLRSRQPDDGYAGLHCQVHDLADLARVRSRAPAEDGEILANARGAPWTRPEPFTTPSPGMRGRPCEVVIW